MAIPFTLVGVGLFFDHTPFGVDSGWPHELSPVARPPRFRIPLGSVLGF